MKLATEVLKFFHRELDRYVPLSTLKDFTDQQHINDSVNLIEIVKIIQHFKNSKYLISYKLQPNQTDPFFGEQIMGINFNNEAAKYGSYDFQYYGFQHISEHFSESVRPIVIQKKDKSWDIGTGFLLGNGHTMITARHVLEDAVIIQIKNLKGKLLF